MRGLVLLSRGALGVEVGGRRWVEEEGAVEGVS